MTSFKKGFVALLVTLLIISKIGDAVPVPNPDAEPFMMALFPIFLDEMEVAYNNNNGDIPMAAGVAAGKTLDELRKSVFRPIAALTGVDYS